jgi:hypothetical protein
MAVLVEQTYGRATLIECMLDPRRLLATYNGAVTVSKTAGLPLWSERLLKAVRAEPAMVGIRGPGNGCRALAARPRCQAACNRLS